MATARRTEPGTPGAAATVDEGPLEDQEVVLALEVREVALGPREGARQVDGMVVVEAAHVLRSVDMGLGQELVVEADIAVHDEPHLLVLQAEVVEGVGGEAMAVVVIHVHGPAHHLLEVHLDDQERVDARLVTNEEVVGGLPVAIGTGGEEGGRIVARGAGAYAHVGRVHLCHEAAVAVEAEGVGEALGLIVAHDREAALTVDQDHTHQGLVHDLVRVRARSQLARVEAEGGVPLPSGEGQARIAKEAAEAGVTLATVNLVVEAGVTLHLASKTRSSYFFLVTIFRSFDSTKKVH